MSHSPLSRRDLLIRTASAAIGLPLLQAIGPGARLFAADPPVAAVKPKRLCVIFVPHGMLISNFLPTKTGRDFPMSPTLEPLADLSGRFSVVSNLQVRPGDSIGHHVAELFLTNEVILDNDFITPNRLSMDRLVVKRNEGQTLLPSLELSLSAFNGLGIRNTLSFDQQGTPLAGQRDPRAVFERLFGSADDTKTQRAALIERRSILDEVMPEVRASRARLGRSDQRVLEEYLASIRETEAYLQRLEMRIDKPTTPDEQGLPADDGKVSTRIRTMLDLIYLAFRGDLTRVVTFVVFKERADAEQQYPELGLVGEHHGWTHEYGEHGGEQRKAAAKILSTVDRFHCEQVAYFLKRLRDTPEGNGTMLDNTLVLYGSGMGFGEEGGIHNTTNLPILVAGGEGLGVRQGQHIHYQQPENFANLHLTLLQRLGVDCDQWKDSTRVLSELVA